jgi:hypothetical protein
MRFVLDAANHLKAVSMHRHATTCDIVGPASVGRQGNLQATCKDLHDDICEVLAGENCCLSQCSMEMRTLTLCVQLELVGTDLSDCSESAEVACEVDEDLSSSDPRSGGEDVAMKEKVSTGMDDSLENFFPVISGGPMDTSRSLRPCLSAVIVSLAFIELLAV